MAPERRNCPWLWALALKSLGLSFFCNVNTFGLTFLGVGSHRELAMAVEFIKLHLPSEQPLDASSRGHSLVLTPSVPSSLMSTHSNFVL